MLQSVVFIRLFIYHYLLPRMVTLISITRHDFEDSSICRLNNRSVSFQVMSPISQSLISSQAGRKEMFESRIYVKGAKGGTYNKTSP